MRYPIGLIMSVLSSLAKAEGSMTDLPLTVTIQCVDNVSCTFTGEDMPITIKVNNTSDVPIEFASRYARKIGPRIKLIDRTTLQHIDLRTSLASRTLLSEFERIAPGGYAEINETISAASIRHFRNYHVDLMVEVRVVSDARFKIGEEPVRFNGQGRFEILGEDTTAQKETQNR